MHVFHDLSLTQAHSSIICGLGREEEGGGRKRRVFAIAKGKDGSQGILLAPGILLIQPHRIQPP